MAKSKSNGTPPGLDDGRVAVLEKALGEITKRYGDGAVMRLGESAHQAVAAIPTGSLAL
ncbi:MAG: hypothetical protein WBZ24_06985, partial [Anaerolineales bacterium]